MKRLFLVTILVLLSAHKVQSHVESCFSGNSVTGFLEMKCSSTSTYCMQYVSSGVMFRSCDNGATQIYCPKGVGINHYLNFTITCCDTDNCNGRQFQSVPQTGPGDHVTSCFSGDSKSGFYLASCPSPSKYCMVYTSLGMTFKGCDNGEADVYCSAGIGSTMHGGVTYDCCSSNNCNWRVVTRAPTLPPVTQQVTSCYKNIGFDTYVLSGCPAPSKYCIEYTASGMTTRGCDNGADVLICSNGIGLTTYLGVEYKCCGTNNCNGNVSLIETTTTSTTTTTTTTSSTSTKIASTTKITTTSESTTATSENTRRVTKTENDTVITSCYTGASTVGYSIMNCSSPSTFCLTYKSADTTVKSCDNGRANVLCPNGVGANAYNGVHYTCCNSNNCNRYTRFANTAQVTSCYSGTSLLGYKIASCSTPSIYCVAYTSTGVTVKGCDDGLSSRYCPNGAGSATYVDNTYKCCKSNNCNSRADSNFAPNQLFVVIFVVLSGVISLSI